jgi:hypothetical protein
VPLCINCSPCACSPGLVYGDDRRHSRGDHRSANHAHRSRQHNGLRDKQRVRRACARDGHDVPIAEHDVARYHRSRRSHRCVYNDNSLGVPHGYGTHLRLRRLGTRFHSSARVRRGAVVVDVWMDHGNHALRRWFHCGGGEWFQMWQSSMWNGPQSARRYFLIASVGLILAHLPQRELPGRP